RGADEAERTARDGLTVALGPGCNGLMHGGHRCVPGRVKYFQPLEECGHIKTWGTSYTGTSHQRRKRRTNEAVDMKKWHHTQAAFLRGQLEGHLHVVSGCANVRVGEGNKFRPCCCP